MFGHKGNPERDQDTLARPPEPATRPTPTSEPPIGTISAAKVNPYADPGVPPLQGEDSTVNFHAAFEVVIDVEVGISIPDPLQQLDPKERAVYRDELEDVINAQRYGRSLGSVSRH